MAEAEVKTFWQRQRLAEAEVENPHGNTTSLFLAVTCRFLSQLRTAAQYTTAKNSLIDS